MAKDTMTLVQRNNKQRFEAGEDELDVLTKVEEVVEEEAVTPEVEPTTEEEKTFKKRYGDLRRHLSQKESDWKKKQDDLQEQIDQLKQATPKIQAPASNEDLEEWKQKYPQVAAIVESIALERAEEIADRKFESAKLDLAEIKKGQEETLRERSLSAIKKVHADLDEIQDSDEFWDWIDDQPAWANDAINSSDPKSVIRVLDLYKSDKGLTKDHRKDKEREAARKVTTKAKPAVSNADKPSFSESQIQRMSPKEYEDKEDAIMEAIRTGNFEYDISGGAR